MRFAAGHVALLLVAVSQARASDDLLRFEIDAYVEQLSAAERAGTPLMAISSPLAYVPDTGKGALSFGLVPAISVSEDDAYSLAMTVGYVIPIRDRWALSFGVGWEGQSKKLSGTRRQINAFGFFVSGSYAVTDRFSVSLAYGQPVINDGNANRELRFGGSPAAIGGVGWEFPLNERVSLGAGLSLQYEFSGVWWLNFDFGVAVTF